MGAGGTLTRCNLNDITIGDTSVQSTAPMLEFTAVDCNVSNVSVYNSTGVGIHINGKAKLVNCTATSTLVGLKCDDAAGDMTYVNCKGILGAVYGFQFPTVGALVSMTNCEAINNASYGVYLNTTDARIIGGRFYDNRGGGAAQPYGIFEDSGGGNNLISGGYFAGNTVAPVYTQGVGTKVKDCDGYNPVTKFSPILQGSGTAFLLLPYDAVYVITTATGLSGLTLDGTALAPIAAVGDSFFVAAGHSLVPTYSGTPVFKVLPI